MHLPTLPLAGAGYLLPDIDGLAVFGASSQPGDADADVRDADHAFNLQRLAQLSPASLPTSGLHPHACRAASAGAAWPTTGCRWWARCPTRAFLRRPGERLDEVPRRPGLYVFSALGSRGISWAALGAQVLAAQISGAPVPLESSLVDALDPARFAMRAARRAQPRRLKSASPQLARGAPAAPPSAALSAAAPCILRLASSAAPEPVLRSAFSFSFSSFFFFLASSRWRFSNE